MPRVNLELEAIMRNRLEEARQQNRDLARAALAAIYEYDLQKIGGPEGLLGEVKRVEVHRGTENRYVIHMTHGLDEGLIELTQAELAENHKAFSERYLQNFNRLPVFPKGTWPSFVDALLSLEQVVILEDRESVSEEEHLVEQFIERAQRLKLTRDIHESLLEENSAYWDDETGTILYRSLRVENFIKSKNSKTTVARFGQLLSDRGVVIRASFQHKIPPKDAKGKPLNLRFWRLSPAALGLSATDVVAPKPLAELPPDMPSHDAMEGAG